MDLFKEMEQWNWYQISVIIVGSQSVYGDGHYIMWNIDMLIGVLVSNSNFGNTNNIIVSNISLLKGVGGHIHW